MTRSQQRLTVSYVTLMQHLSCWRRVKMLSVCNAADTVSGGSIMNQRFGIS